MRKTKRYRKFLAGWLGACTVGLNLSWPGVILAQTFTDPVEDLRQALKVQVRDPLKNPDELSFRSRNLTHRVDNLTTVSDLRRALTLQEWRDEDGDQQIARIDQPARARVARKFEQILRSAMQRDSSASKIAAATLLAEIGVSVRGADTAGGAARALAPDVAKLFEADDPQVRVAAAQAIGKINPSPQVALPPLEKIIGGDGVPQRQAAAAALNNLVQQVIQIAKGRSATKVEASRPEVVTLVKSVVTAAGKALKDSDPKVRLSALEAIQNAAIALGDLVPEPFNQRDLPPAGRQLSADERTEIEDFHKQIEDERKELLPLATALRDQMSPIAAILRDAAPDVRLLSRQTLEEEGYARLRMLRREESVPPLPEAAIAPVPNKPKEKANVHRLEDPLMEGFKKILTTLATSIADPDPQNRMAVVNVLEMLGEDAAPAAPTLILALNDPNRFVRWAAVRTLAKTGPVFPDRSVPALGRLLSDPDLDVRLAASLALEKYGSEARPAVPELMKAANTGDAEIRVAAIRALEALGSDAKQAIPAIRQAMSSPDVRVRRAAAETLGRLGPVALGAEEELRQALNDKDGDVRRAASDALLSILR